MWWTLPHGPLGSLFMQAGERVFTTQSNKYCKVPVLSAFTFSSWVNSWARKKYSFCLKACLSLFLLVIIWEDSGKVSTLCVDNLKKKIIRKKRKKMKSRTLVPCHIVLWIWLSGRALSNRVLQANGRRAGMTTMQKPIGEEGPNSTWDNCSCFWGLFVVFQRR